MGRLETELSEEHLKSIGRITAGFALLEQVVSFYIWSLVEKDQLFQKFVDETTEPSMIESFVNFYVRTPTGLEHLTGKRLGQIMTAELSFSQKVALLSSLHKYRADNAEKELQDTEFKKLLHRVAQAEEKRNTVIHSLWTPDTTKGKVTRIKTTAKRLAGLRFQFQSMNVQELDEAADFIASVAYDVETSVVRIYLPNFRK